MLVCFLQTKLNKNFRVFFKRSLIYNNHIEALIIFFIATYFFLQYVLLNLKTVKSINLLFSDVEILKKH